MSARDSIKKKHVLLAEKLFSGMSQVDAYKEVCDTSNQGEATIRQQANQYANSARVKALMDEMKTKMVEKYLWKREDSVIALKDAIDMAKGADNPAGVVAAVKELNAMHGFNAPQKLDITSKISKIERVIVKVENASDSDSCLGY